MATVNGVGACCVGGRIDEGDPKGKEEEIGGIKCYVAESKTGSREFAVVIATDVFGYTLPNVRLIADSYAEQGYYCLVPDMFRGSEPPADMMATINNINGANKDATFLNKMGAFGSILRHFPYFIFRNSGTKNLDTIKQVISYLRKELGVKKVACQGYCWGGKIAAVIAQEEDFIDAAIPSHAGGLSFPKDYEALKKPAFFQWAEFDSQIPTSMCEKAIPLIEKAGGKGKIYPGVHHGFAVRGNLKDEQDKKMRLEAFDDAVTFLNAKLGKP